MRYFCPFYSILTTRSCSMNGTWFRWSLQFAVWHVLFHDDQPVISFHIGIYDDRFRYEGWSLIGYLKEARTNKRIVAIIEITSRSSYSFSQRKSNIKKTKKVSHHCVTPTSSLANRLVFPPSRDYPYANVRISETRALWTLSYAPMRFPVDRLNRRRTDEKPRRSLAKERDVRALINVITDVPIFPQRPYVARGW